MIWISHVNFTIFFGIAIIRMTVFNAVISWIFLCLGEKTDFQKEKERNIFELEIGRYSFLLMPLIQLFEISLPCSIKVSLSLETDMIIGQTGLEKNPVCCFIQKLKTYNIHWINVYYLKKPNMLFFLSDFSHHFSSKTDFCDSSLFYNPILRVSFVKRASRWHEGS